MVQLFRSNPSFNSSELWKFKLDTLPRKIGVFGNENKIELNDLLQSDIRHI